MSKVLHARLHQTVHTAETGDLGNVLPPKNKTLENLDMSFESEVLEIRFKYRGKQKELYIPIANVVSMDIEWQEK